MSSFGVSPLELMAQDAMLQGLAFLDEFTYSLSWIAGTSTALGVGAIATVNNQLQVNGDSDFIVQDQNITAFDNGAPPAIVLNPNLLVIMTRSGAGRELMNGAQHVLNIYGGYQQNRVPGKKPYPGLLNMSNNMTFQLQNLSTTVFSRVDIALQGFKVYYTVNAAGVTGTRQMVFHAL